jgi:ATP-dependent RNA helicase RhlE
MKFEQYGISEDIKKNLERLGFKRPTDIQFKAIPSIMNGEDVLAIAQTGTGKTAAFAIPVVDRIHGEKKSKRSAGIQCVVMVPTRELAQQIGGVFKTLARHTRVKVFSLHGGIEQDAQVKKLQSGIDVLVATPGRMFDLANQGYVNLESVAVLVIDEADRMLDAGFAADITYIKKMLTRKHQTLFFSATINKEIKKLAYSHVKSSAIRIQLSPEDPVSKNVSHFVMFVEMDDKRFFLEKFIKDNPDSKIIVFVRTRVRAERVAKAMERGAIRSMTIHGEKEQHERTEVMRKFREGDGTVLIATDVSARGIDIPDVDYVVNYDLPEDPETYVHRVGRTGRGVRRGIAVSLCSRDEKDRLDEIEQLLKKDIEVIKIGKRDYARTIDPHREEGIRALIDDYENRRRKRPGKRRAGD